jgi:hypothetical protein
MHSKTFVNPSHGVDLESVVSSSKEIHCETHCVG